MWQSMAPDFTKELFPMKVVFSTCCGVDVHKTFLVATIIKTTKGVQRINGLLHKIKMRTHHEHTFLLGRGHLVTFNGFDYGIGFLL